MVEKYRCVIDAEGRYVTYVLILDGNIQYYNLKESESLIDAKPPVMRTSTARDGYLVPIWDIDASTWAEGATAGEIAAWEALHPVLPQTEVTPTQLDRIEAQATYTAMMTDTLLEEV